MDVEKFKYNKETPSFTLYNGCSVCEKCKHKKKDLVIDGRIIVKGSSNRFCAKYLSGKPNSVFDLNECDFYSVTK